jgi:IclR family acetate operon transcriptional repressor
MLLERLANAQDGMLLTDVAQQVGLAVSTAHRLLGTLEKQGFIYQDAERARWYVGVKAFAIGNAFLTGRNVVVQARPFLRRLMEQAGETTNLAVLSDGEAVILAQEECREMMRMLVPLGSRAPIHASGVGKALLAALPDVEVAEILHRHGLPQLTANTIDTPDNLRAAIGEVRTQGYAYDNEEHTIGMRCVAATIYDEYTQPLAAISVSGPRSRMPNERIPALGQLVVQIAGELTHTLGGRLPRWQAHQAA